MPNVMGSTAASQIWEWIDDDGVVRFVGFGTLGYDLRPPWQRLWDQRHSAKGSLGAWLRGLGDVPPRRSTAVLPSVLLPAKTAAAIARHRRRQLRQAGVRLLSTRVHRVGPRTRPVLGYPSLRQAAAAMNVPKSTLWDRLRRS
jgi:hypothetical protein